ncbi:MAG: hypothetical protein ABIW47_18665 [Ginsengibacter sp.]|jgi:hypothetical protein
MRYTIIFSTFLFFILSGCNKDKFDTVPDLKFTSVNTTQLVNGGIIQFNLSFTDKEGDISNGIYVEKTSPECPVNNFEQSYFIPDFPAIKNQKGEIQVSFGYNVNGIPNISPTCSKNETATFRFVLKDKAGNVSDTVTSPPITIVY